MDNNIDYSPILRPIVKSTMFKSLIDELNEIWIAEQKKRVEFYNWVTPDIKAEFIEGEIIIHSPVRSLHNTVLQNINNLILNYVLKNKLGYVGYEKVLVRLHRNDFEPDLVFFKNEKANLFENDLTIFPVPDLVVEVLSDSTSERDRGVKLSDYQYNNVGEYWIVDADNSKIEQYVMTDGKYIMCEYSAEDTIQSVQISSFSCPVNAFFDKEENLKALGQMLN